MDDNPYASPKEYGVKATGTPLKVYFWLATGVFWLAAGAIRVVIWFQHDKPVELFIAIMHAIVGCAFIWMAGVESNAQQPPGSDVNGDELV